MKYLHSSLIALTLVFGTQKTHANPRCVAYTAAIAASYLCTVATQIPKSKSLCVASAMSLGGAWLPYKFGSDYLAAGGIAALTGIVYALDTMGARNNEFKRRYTTVIWAGRILWSALSASELYSLGAWAFGSTVEHSDENSNFAEDGQS